MTNVEIRVEMTKKGLKQWELAQLLGISESAFCRKFRKELPEDEKQKILELIHNNKKEGEAGGTVEGQ